MLCDAPSGSGPPGICGVNTGEHMYVDASSSFCNNLGLAIGSLSTVTRSWEIRVPHLNCDYTNLTPSAFFRKGTLLSWQCFKEVDRHIVNCVQPLMHL